MDKTVEAIVNFVNDCFERTLKLLQSLSQIGATFGPPGSHQVLRWTTAGNQFALGRRYLYFFKWINCWMTAYRLLQGSKKPSSKYSTNGEKTQVQFTPTGFKTSGNHDNIKSLLGALKFSLLGMFLFLEMFTILNAMSITDHGWARSLQLEAWKLWFYSLIVSVSLGLYELFRLSSKPPQALKSGSSKDEKSQGIPTTTASVTRQRQTLHNALVADISDLIIGACVTGYFLLDPVTAGIAGTISAAIAMREAWKRVNP
ncbi:hypothetical protein CLAIMM_03365 isoform 2 [Cladophialophora immunda]|nr:hypothetical protein CLAIMM_03365 isoform 2 [Cladophialophora immunda]